MYQDTINALIFINTDQCVVEVTGVYTCCCMYSSCRAHRSTPIPGMQILASLGAALRYTAVLPDTSVLAAALSGEVPNCLFDGPCLAWMCSDSEARKLSLPGTHSQSSTLQRMIAVAMYTWYIRIIRTRYQVCLQTPRTRIPGTCLHMLGTSCYTWDCCTRYSSNTRIWYLVPGVFIQYLPTGALPGTYPR